MGRLRTTFDRLRDEGRAALVPYVTAGDPDLETTGHVLDALADAGADVIELGIPFSDPMADGPIIQAAMGRALSRPIDLEGILAAAAKFRRDWPETGLVLFGYLNPFFRYGLEETALAARDAGADGLLVVDLPPEERGELLPHLEAAGLDLIGLFTPTSNDARIRLIAEGAGGFAYCVSTAGVTGGDVSGAADLPARVEAIRRGTGLPVAVGFGVRSPADAARIAGFADGIVVGSALVQALSRQAPVECPAVAADLARGLREAIDLARRPPAPVVSFDRAKG